MTNKCGQCRQFTRVKGSPVDMCGAWEQPTTATRQACEFFMPTIAAKQKVPPITSAKKAD
ncbi:hypothetical protein [Vibrio sp. CAU 1672]|uniref:hypothetical protein n=1 Tax=Vibrio sp. CAU 1672 TaxID=3032594 RepID=UPI0023DB9326|nr:hypothetical protein [Vibrio sp. CAU 1672]MDF2153407.1 hypothetical protein [Vibrio sp. CAU 1672]